MGESPGAGSACSADVGFSGPGVSWASAARPERATNMDSRAEIPLILSVSTAASLTHEETAGEADAPHVTNDTPKEPAQVTPLGRNSLGCHSRSGPHPGPNVNVNVNVNELCVAV